MWTLNISMNLLIIFMFLFISTPSSALNLIRFFTGYKSIEESDNEMKNDRLVSQFELCLKLMLTSIKSMVSFGHMLQLLAIF